MTSPSAPAGRTTSAVTASWRPRRPPASGAREPRARPRPRSGSCARCAATARAATRTTSPTRSRAGAGSSQPCARPWPRAGSPPRRSTCVPGARGTSTAAGDPVEVLGHPPARGRRARGRGARLVHQVDAAAMGAAGGFEAVLHGARDPRGRSRRRSTSTSSTQTAPAWTTSPTRPAGAPSASRSSTRSASAATTRCSRSRLMEDAVSASNGRPARARRGGDWDRGRVPARDRARGDVALGERGALRRRPHHALRRLRLARADGLRGPRLRAVRLHGAAHGAANGPLCAVRRCRGADGGGRRRPVDRPRRRGIGAIIANGGSGATSREEQHALLLERGADVSPFAIPLSVANMGAGQVSMELGLRTGRSRPSQPARPAPTRSARRSTSCAGGPPA